jgi:hypothetical protein
MPITKGTPPVIFFKGDSPDAPMSFKMAYLVRIDGKPWAYANLHETHLDPQQARALPLIERLIAVDPTSVPADPTYLYQRAADSP